VVEIELNGINGLVCEYLGGLIKTNISICPIINIMLNGINLIKGEPVTALLPIETIFAA
jgi:hypothetical protein